MSNYFSINEDYEEDACQILQYFHSCSSIRQTAWNYDMEMEELYELIPQWDACREGLRSADDYDECRMEVIGRYEYDEERECEMEPEELQHRLRRPEPDEITKIIADYNNSVLSLYEVADRYDLKITNLFRLLKENKVIDKETDAKNYSSFYVEHNGAGTEWDGNSEFGLIDAFYSETN